MIKYTFWITVICLGLACNQANKQNTTATNGSKHFPADMMITPGGGIGRITIGEDADSTVSVLGKPNKTDGAMGAQLLTWYLKPNGITYQINVYSHRNMGGPDEATSHIKAIRVTSPGYNTTDMVHAGMPFDTIKTHFNLKQSAKIAGKASIYTDTKAGIAFEVDAKNICRAIIVFARGDDAVHFLNMGD